MPSTETNFTARTAYRNNVAQGFVMIGVTADSGHFTFDEDLAIMGTKDDVAAELRRLQYGRQPPLARRDDARHDRRSPEILRVPGVLSRSGIRRLDNQNGRIAKCWMTWKQTKH